MIKDTKFRQTALSIHLGVFILCTICAPPILAQVELTADTIYYTGEITAQQNKILFQNLEGKTIQRMQITSSGGEVDAAIRLGLWIYAHDIDVVVNDLCLSSCANYIFTAGKTKTIRKGAVVAWHGNYRHLLETGLWKDEIPLRMHKYGEDRNTALGRIQMQVQRLVALEDAFFRQTRINGYICWFGKMPPHNVPDFYTLSREEMEKFGLTNVSVPRNYEDTDLGHFTVDIQFIKTQAARLRPR